MKNKVSLAPPIGPISICRTTPSQKQPIRYRRDVLLPILLGYMMLTPFPPPHTARIPLFKLKNVSLAEKQPYVGPYVPTLRRKLPVSESSECTVVIYLPSLVALLLTRLRVRNRLCCGGGAVEGRLQCSREQGGGICKVFLFKFSG